MPVKAPSSDAASEQVECICGSGLSTHHPERISEFMAAHKGCVIVWRSRMMHGVNPLESSSPVKVVPFDRINRGDDDGAGEGEPDSD